MPSRHLTSAAIAVSVGLACPSTHAQVSGFAVNRYEPSERGSDWFVNESLDLRGGPSPAAGLVLDWAYAPLVVQGQAGVPGARRPRITDQVFAHVGAAVVIHDRYRLGVDVPAAIVQAGDPDKPAFGDVRVSGDVRFLGRYGGVISAAAGAQVHLPTGRRSLFTSDGTVRLTPRLLFAGDYSGFVYAAKLGLSYRPLDATFEDRQLGSEAIFSAAGGVKVNDRFVFGPELYGSTVITGGDRAFRARSTPLEMLLGGHLMLAEHWKVGSAIGPGFTRGDGTPVMRVLLSIELTPDICVDQDGDGICAQEDACPTIDGVRENHGCPADRDHDGFTDAVDACPDAAGKRTADPKTSGCPDRDDDGVADRSDACVDVAGIATDDPKTTGCPRDDARAEKIEIPQRIMFGPAAAALAPNTAGALEGAAKVLRDNPRLRVRIEGHADDREAKAGDVKKLSLDRADAVRTWLEQHGVAADRLRSEGYGAERLVNTTATDEGRAENRRVELHVIEEPTVPGAK